MINVVSPKLRGLLNSIRNVLLFRFRYPWIGHGRKIHLQWSTKIWSPHKLVRLGDHVDIGSRCEISTDLIIGNHVLVGDSVASLARDAHSSYVPFATFDAPRGDKFQVVVEDDVWIGYGSIVLSGVTIGRGAIIAAGAIVAKDVPPYSVVVSQPSVVLKRRFSEEQVQHHEEELRRRGVIRDEVGAAAPRGCC